MCGCKKFELKVNFTIYLYQRSCVTSPKGFSMIENVTNKTSSELIQVPPPPNLPEFKQVTSKTYSPEEDLLVSRAIRGAITKELVKEKIPTDAKEVATLLSVLKDQDQQALTIIRAKIEKDANDLSGENAALAREILKGMSGVKPENLNYTRLPSDFKLPELPPELNTREFVPGEMDVGMTNTSIEDFRKRVGVDIVFAETDKEEE